MYAQIYNEKISQVWRFSHIKVDKEDADDEQWYDSEEEEDEVSATAEPSIKTWTPTNFSLTHI